MAAVVRKVASRATLEALTPDFISAGSVQLCPLFLQMAQRRQAPPQGSGKVSECSGKLT